MLTLPMGWIELPDGPISVQTPHRLTGWVLFSTETTDFVEISVDGRPLGRARLGLPRPDLASITDVAAAPTCGFEFWIGPADVAPDAESVTLRAEAVGRTGRRLSIGPVVVQLLPARPDDGVDNELEDAQLARMRQRVARAARRRPVRAQGLRLLAYSHRLERSGAPLYLLTLLGHLKSQGLHCSVVSPEDGPLRAVFERMGIAVHVSHGAQYPDAISYESKMWELAAWAAPHGFDVVHVNAIDSFLGVDLATRLGIPAIWAIHESFSPDEWFAANEWSPETYVRERMMSAFRSASAVLLATDTTRNQLLAYGPSDRLVTLPYGIDLERVAAYRAGADRVDTRKRLGVPQEATLVLSLASIEPRKAQTTIATAFAGVAKAHPGTHLALVGETGQNWTAPYSAALREFIRRTGLESRVTIAPVTANYYQWLEIADIFVLASDIESLPLAVLEAMAFEATMVATAVFGLPELVHESLTGFLCRPSHVGDLTAALGRALCLAVNDRRRVARAGAQAVTHQHDIQRYVARYGALVRALVEDPQAPPAPFLADDQRGPPMVATKLGSA